MYHAIIEQTREYENRVKFDPIRNIFYETESKVLHMCVIFPYPYGWIKESGTPPGPHLDVILLSSNEYKLGDEILIKIVGCFVRNDGDSKFIGILPERLETDFFELPEDEKADLSRLYPLVGDGEGWYGAEKAMEIIKKLFKQYDRAFNLKIECFFHIYFVEIFIKTSWEIEGYGKIWRIDNVVEIHM